MGWQKPYEVLQEAHGLALWVKRPLALIQVGSWLPYSEAGATLGEVMLRHMVSLFLEVLRMQLGEATADMILPCDSHDAEGVVASEDPF